MKHAARLLIVVLAAALAAALGASMLALPEFAVRLPDAVTTKLDASGVSHPVTAVLLNFRGYDTLLEVGVLLLALFGVLALARPAPRAAPAPAHPVLQTFARVLVPLMVLVAGYLLWAGAHRPGGAFQAGAVLAAAGVLLGLAGLLPPWATPNRMLRVGLALGFAVFLAVAVAGLAQGALLEYPPAAAGVLILLVEAGLTLSIGLVLASLYLASAGEGP